MRKLNYMMYIQKYSISIFLLIFTFIPYFSVHERYLIPVAFSVVILFALMNKKNIVSFNNMTSELRIILLIFFIQTIVIIISLLVNINFVHLSSFNEILKYVGFSIVLLFSYYVTSIVKTEDLINIIVLTIKFILVMQLLFCIDQALSYNILSEIYSYSKVNIKTFRTVGTLVNPNHFAWVILQFGIIIFLFDKHKSRLYWVFFCFILVLLSGSKSTLIITLIDISFILIIKSKYKTISFQTLRILFIMLIVCAFFMFFLFIFKDTFRGVASLFQLLENGPMSMSTISVRILHWNNTMNYFFNNLDILKLLFGYSNIAIFNNIDNNYIYIIVRYGLVGALVYLIMFSYIIYISIKYWNIKIGIFIFQFIIMLLILGVFGDNLGGWIYPIILYLFLGIFLNLIKKHRTNNEPLDI